MRRRSVRRALWCAGAVVLGVVAIFFNHPAGPPGFRGADGKLVPGYTARGTLADPSGHDVAEVQAALDRRAKAVLDGDRGAFMSTVDTARPRFVAQQLVVWQNTRQLPFQKLEFRLVGTVDPDGPLTSPSFLVRVQTTYQLRGFDSAPIEVEDGLTFVRRGDAWKLSSISDADDQFATTSPPAPWDGRPIAAYADHRYLAVVDRGRRRLALRIIVRCEEGSRASNRLLGADDALPTVVLATSHVPGFEKLVGPDAEAVTYPLDGPEGTTSGWGVVVNPRELDHAVASPVVLPHEVAHLATQDYIAYLPAWLTEGAAEYVGWHSHGGLAAVMAARGYRPSAVATSLPRTSTFYRGDIQRNYVEATALVGWIEEHEGRGAVLSLMRAYADAGGYDLSFDPDAASTAILRDTLGVTPVDLARGEHAELEAAAAEARTGRAHTSRRTFCCSGSQRRRVTRVRDTSS